MIQAIYSQEAKLKGWKLTTDDPVHKAGVRIFKCKFWQWWSRLRNAVNLKLAGKDAVLVSALAIEGETHTPEGKKTVYRAS